MDNEEEYGINMNIATSVMDAAFSCWIEMIQDERDYIIECFEENKKERELKDDRG